VCSSDLAELSDGAVVALTIGVNVGNIRRDPHPQSEILFKLKQGDTVKRIKTEGEWYQVQLENGIVAWAHQSIF